jgi:DNA polymerase-1
MRVGSKVKTTTLLVDANNLFMRAFFALPRSLSSVGVGSTGAIVGVLQSLKLLIETYLPAETIIVWDGSPTWRRKIYPEYKRRKSSLDEETVQTIRQQREFLSTDILPRLGFVQYRHEDFEADDFIAYFALERFNEGGSVVILSTDHDFWQLVRPRLIVIDPIGKFKVSKKFFKESTTFSSPEFFLDHKIICGDRGDNVPVVKGLSGEKRFQKYLPVLQRNHLSHLCRWEHSSRWPKEFRNYYDPLFMNWQLVDLTHAASWITPRIVRSSESERFPFPTRGKIYDLAVEYGLMEMSTNVDDWYRLLNS